MSSYILYILYIYIYIYIYQTLWNVLGFYDFLTLSIRIRVLEELLNLLRLDNSYLRLAVDFMLRARE